MWFGKLFNRVSSPAPQQYHMRINDLPQKFCVKPRQTVLHAALDGGLDFPHLCRVGSCGRCRSRVAEGKVSMLTDPSYVLRAQDVRDGHILACQAVLHSDAHIVSIFPLGQATPPSGAEKLAAQIVDVVPLSARVFQIRLRLERSLEYRAGQFMHLFHPDLDGERAYSIVQAMPSSATDLHFHVSPVAGGQMARLLDDVATRELMGTPVHLTGPFGDFGWPTAPNFSLLCAAGGSGVGVMVTILAKALAEGQATRVVFLYGARREPDLYWLDRLRDLERHWPQPFEIIPVLSDQDVDERAAVPGRRGMLADTVPDLHLDGEIAGWQALLCGPPAMVDSTMQALLRRGFDQRQIAFDRFDVRGAPEPWSSTSRP